MTLRLFNKQLAELSEKDDLICSISVIDSDEIKRRYDLVLEKENPSINHVIDLSAGHFMYETLANTQVAIGALPLKECIKIPGIKDGTLFHKNVRQSLGLSNTVNKGIRQTIYSDKHKDFFFFHNGITAICNRMEKKHNELKLHGLSLVKPALAGRCASELRRAGRAGTEMGPVAIGPSAARKWAGIVA